MHKRHILSRVIKTFLLKESPCCLQELNTGHLVYKTLKIVQARDTACSNVKYGNLQFMLVVCLVRRANLFVLLIVVLNI